jgi:glycosyltransferase involved in cell wall biosynthesis
MFANAIGWPDPQSEFYRIAKMMEETCLRRADAIYSSSRCSAEWCERYHGCEAGSIPVIHTGIDTDVFCPRDVPKAQAPTVIFVGKLERNKGVDVLVDAALEVASEIRDLRLILLGRGNPDLISELGRKAELSGHPELLHVVGYVKQSELPEHLSRAHVFAAPSQYEGGPGFVYLEAMACGLPVIGCAGSGASEVITHGETGFLVPPQDRRALSDALRRLLTDAELRRDCGRMARDYVTREANRQTCLKRLEEFYSSVALGRTHKEAIS